MGVIGEEEQNKLEDEDNKSVHSGFNAVNKPSNVKSICDFYLKDS